MNANGQREITETRTERGKTHFSLPSWEAFAAMLAGMALSCVVHIPQLRTLIPFSLFLMLYPVLLNSTPGSVVKLVQNPKLLAASLLMNFALSPPLLWVLAGSHASPELWPFVSAMVFYSAIPCGGMVPVYSLLLGGDPGATIGVMVLSLVLSVGLVSAWSEILTGARVVLPHVLIISNLFFAVFLPLTVAWVSNRFLPGRLGADGYAQYKRRCAPLAKLGMMSLFFIIFSQGGNILASNPGPFFQLLPRVALFHAILLAISCAVSRLLRFAPQDSQSLTVCVSVKNNALSTALTGIVFGPDVAAITAAIGPLIQFPIMLTYVSFWKKRMPRIS